MDLEWNASGTTICCAYGRLDHDSICLHKGALCTWNIDRLKIDMGKPDVSIETSSCVSALATHPEYPTIVAVGLFNGEINVYDMRQAGSVADGDPLVAAVTDKNEMHKDQVTVLKWIKNAKTAKKKFMVQITFLNEFNSDLIAT